MEKTKRKTIGISTVFLLALLLSSSLVILLNVQNDNMVSGATTDYGDIMQYEWPQFGYNGGWQLFSPGPAPDRPDVLWTQRVIGLSQSAGVPGLSATVTAFDGKVFVGVAGSSRSPVNEVYAFDAFTGELVWSTPVYMPQTAPTKLDDTYLFVDGDIGEAGLGYAPVNTVLNYTITVLKTSDGSFVSDLTLPNIAYTPGAGGYFPGVYDSGLRMKYVRGYNYQTSEISYYGINLTDPFNPKVAWKTVFDQSGEELAAADGINWVGTVNGGILAFNGSTGEFMYETRKIGFAQYSATYIDGMLIQAPSSTSLTAYNATTGEILWDRDQGGRAFFSFPGAAAYGRYYACNVAVPTGFVGCWDLNNGDLLWKQPAVYNFGYNMPVVADGKVFIQRYNGAAGGAELMPNTFSCFDAFTGDLLWELPNTLTMDPSVAYGNLYAIIGDTIYCFSEQATQDWSMWRGNVENPGIVQGTGPADISVPDWEFQTPGSITSSPAVVSGKVYFGSRDKNIYCVDAYSGDLLWDYATGMPVMSSPAVSNGVVYTGSDDGNVYALDANTGEMKWTKHLTDETTFVAASTWQPRSSPIIVGDSLYVGACDGFLYCLDKDNGNISWKGPTGATSSHPIAGSAAYKDGTIYISSTDNYLYALNADTGAQIWKTRSNATMGRAYNSLFPWSTPVVFNGAVYWAAGPVYGMLAWYSLNTTTGEQIWNITNARGQTIPTEYQFTGNTPACHTPVLLQWNSSLTVVILPEFMGVAVRDAADGRLISHQFVGHEVYSSIAYVDDLQGPKIYVGSDTYSITCINATAMVLNETANAVLSVYTTKAEVQSSPTVWGGKLFVGSTDGAMYMFSDNPNVNMNLYAVSDKGEEMWNNETITVAGRLQPAPNVYDIAGANFGTFAENGLPNTEVCLSVTKPDGTSMNLTATTDNLGNFQVSFSPTDLGSWGWVTYYNGEVKPSITYNAANSEWTSLNVVAAPSTSASPQPTATPTTSPTPAASSSPEATSTPAATSSPEPSAAPEETATPPATATPDVTASPNEGSDGLPVEYIYAAVAVIVIIVVVIGAYVYIARSKK
ncbi:MAG: PQQ-binding-like beta-propeller repeat protein [Candidatus Bathyarchaeota archaeon]|nr:PQQ-binding-like beta-propeller repeat protein [Candidatus Bathyarchaeota archaeon]